MATATIKRICTSQYRTIAIQHNYSIRAPRHVIKKQTMYPTQIALRNYHKFPFKLQQRLLHSSPHPRAIPLVPAIISLSKPTIILTTKLFLKFGRPIFLVFRWIWFLIPTRITNKIVAFFHHRYFGKYSKWNFFAFLSTIWALGFYSYFENLEEVPYSFRRRFSYMVMQDLYEESIEESAGELTKYEDRILPDTHPLHITIQSIVNKLANVCRMNGILDMEFKLYVIDADIKNAYVLPNGNVFVFTGICNVFNDVNSLSILLGHEMSHVVAGHSAESACRESMILMCDALAFMLLSLFIPSNYMFGLQEWFRLQIMHLFTELPFSRMNEIEADYIGLILAKQAGFDIEIGKTMWNKMSDEIGDELPEIFSTHPGHENRSNMIASWIKHVDCLAKHCTVF
eukprot:85806_1